MSTIGTLHRKRDGFEGQLSTMQFAASVVLLPNRRKQGENDPDFEVFAINPNGELIRVGAAWKKAMKAPGREGNEFLSITLDDPSFPAPLNVAAFESEEPDRFNISWRRRQSRPGNAAAA